MMIMLKAFREREKKEDAISFPSSNDDNINNKLIDHQLVNTILEEEDKVLQKCLSH